MTRRRLWLAAVLAVCLLLPTVSTARSETVTGTVVVHPLTITLRTNTAGVRLGEGVDAAATVTNHGSLPVTQVRVVLHAAPGVLISGGGERLVDAIPANSERKVTWRMCLTQAGNYVLLASARPAGFGVVESEAVLLETRPDRVKPCPSS
jgi:hypothetical protein